MYSLAGRYDNPIPTRFIDCSKMSSMVNILYSMYKCLVHFLAKIYKKKLKNSRRYE